MAKALRRILKKYGGVALTFVAALILANAGGLVVHADSVLTSADPTNGKYFQFQSGDLTSSGSVITNSSQNMPYLFNFYKNSASNPQKQYLWSTQPTFDMSHSVSMGFWVKVPQYKSGTKTGDDGFAFVLAKSNSQKTSTSNQGETLGVYSDPDWTSHFGAPTIESSDVTSAVPNSLAIEFDDYPNTGNGDYNQSTSEYDFGTTPGAPHVAWAYPAQNTSYGVVGGNLLNKWRMTLNHNNGTTATSLPSGQWVHMSLVYNGDTSNPTLTYYVNDRDANGDAQSVDGVKVPINFSNLGVTSSDRKLYWGFTSFNTATSASTANSVIFDSYSEGYLPNAELVVNGGNPVYDSVTDSADSSKTTQSVNNGDNLTYNMSLNGVRQELISGATVTSKLPSGMLLVNKDGSYGKITYNANGKTVTQDITASDISSGNLSIKLGSNLQNQLAADSNGIRIGDLNVQLNATVAAAPGTTLDATTVNFKGDSISQTLTGPKLKVADNQASMTAYNGTNKVFPTDDSSTADGSATSILTQSGSTLKYHYQLSGIGSGALTGASLAITKPSSLAWSTDASGNIGKITYTDNASKTNTQNITASDIDATGHVLLNSNLLTGISKGDLQLELNHSAMGAEGTIFSNEQVDLQNNGNTIQTFKSPTLKIAPNLATTGTVKVQDTNYSDSTSISDSTVQLQDVVRYTYTITYNLNDSADKSWQKVTLKPNLLQADNQDPLQLRRVTVTNKNGQTVTTSTGTTPNNTAPTANGYSVDLGTLDSSMADADGMVTVTVALDYELGYLPNGISTITASNATVSGTSASGTHTQTIANPGYKVADTTDAFWIDWNNLTMMPYTASDTYNYAAASAQAAAITAGTPNGRYTLAKDDAYVVLQGYAGAIPAEYMRQYVSINGQQVAGPLPMRNGLLYWNYAFKRNGFTGTIPDTDSANPVSTIGTLHPGVNTIKIWSEDTRTGRLAHSRAATKDPYIEFTVIDPAPSLSVNNDVHFNDTTLTGESEYVPSTDSASDAFALKILYANADSYNWTLSAATSPFTSGGNKLRGELLYQKNGKALTISDATQPLYSDQSGVNDATQVTSSDTDSDGTYDIAGKWTHDAYNADSSTGLYMHVFPDAVADEGSSNYTGTITWTFSSTPTTSSN
jgi:hypothetical protein